MLLKMLGDETTPRGMEPRGSRSNERAFCFVSAYCPLLVPARADVLRRECTEAFQQAVHGKQNPPITNTLISSTFRNASVLPFDTVRNAKHFANILQIQN